MNRTLRFALAAALILGSSTAAAINVFPPNPNPVPVTCSEPYTVQPGASVVVLCTAHTDARPDQWVANVESGHQHVTGHVVETMEVFGAYVTAFVALRNHGTAAVTDTARVTLFDPAGNRPGLAQGDR